MLVIAFDSDRNAHVSCDLDIDPEQDTPRKIISLLEKRRCKGRFSIIVCIEGDEEVASFVDGVDYDLSDEDDLDDEDELDEDVDPDNLHEDKDDFSEDE